jgi:VanZ family protein
MGMISSPVIEPPIIPVRGGVKHFLSAWLPVALCMLVISQESTVYFGADHTSGPLQRFFEFFFGHFTQPEWWRLHLTIRKGGHFLGYGILSVAWFRAFWMSFRVDAPLPKRRMSAHALAMLGTLFVASCDELHQTFLPNRTGSPWDVLVDCSGAALLQMLIWLWMRKRFAAWSSGKTNR